MLLEELSLAYLTLLLHSNKKKKNHSIPQIAKANLGG